MSKNERTARKLLETAMAKMCYPLPDFIDISLTDIECERIAINYPYSFQEIRAAFPVQWMKNNSPLPEPDPDLIQCFSKKWGKRNKTLSEASLELEKARNEFIKSVLKCAEDHKNKLVELLFGVPTRWIKNHWK